MSTGSAKHQKAEVLKTTNLEVEETGPAKLHALTGLLGERLEERPELLRLHGAICGRFMAPDSEDEGVIIHEYFGVDLDLVLTAVKKDLPALKQKINNIVK
ncbi:MAG: hypothetical protein FJZ49_08465 [Candidatus Verstraetearchaeota archaeon]|nr:hypothetical protein [Candidatus Verstraetearchaeota archaeon]